MLGIVIGIVLGLGVLVYFVFVHSEGTIDAPRIQTGSTEEPAEESANSGTGTKPGSRAGTTTKSEAVPVVKVIGGAPPIGAGAKQLHFKKGEKVRFEIETDEPFSFEIKGLGISESLEKSSIISFPAKKAGQFPVIATATLIGVADLLIEK